VTVKFKYSDFSQATRSQTVSGAVSDVDQMLEIAELLLASVFPFKRPVRLLGVTLSSLISEESGQEPQLDLGFDAARPENEKARRGRRCGRLFEKNRTATGRRSAAVPTDVPGRRRGPSETRSSAGGGASLR
jgi:hypothetical protein